jgi:hypothetical protein
MTRCSWCGRALQPSRGGSPKKFCSSRHRTEFHSAARRFAERAVAAGVVTLDAVKVGDLRACTLIQDAACSADISEAEGGQNALGALVDEALSVDETAALPETVGLLLRFVTALRAEKPPDA